MIGYGSALVFLSLLCTAPSFAQSYSLRDLPHLIDSLYQADQATASIRPADSAAAAYQRVIRTNFPIVEAIFDRYGYPGYDMIGKGSSDQYFLLVQHSDFQTVFQQRVLAALKEHVERKNASGQSFAFLTDRIELTNGRPQIYGTQVFMSGRTTIKPCIDTSAIDLRRASVGLEPLQQYLQKCNDIFYRMNPHIERPAQQTDTQ